MKVTPQLEALTDICKENSKIDVDLYGKYDVKRGQGRYRYCPGNAGGGGSAIYRIIQILRG